MNPLASVLRAVRSVIHPAPDCHQDQQIENAIASVMKSNEHRSKAAEALKEAADIARQGPHFAINDMLTRKSRK
jgi:hypothetical protein